MFSVGGETVHWKQMVNCNIELIYPLISNVLVERKQLHEISRKQENSWNIKLFSQKPLKK